MKWELRGDDGQVSSPFFRDQVGTKGSVKLSEAEYRRIMDQEIMESHAGHPACICTDGLEKYRDVCEMCDS